jgi:hypothetical protein
MLFKTKNIHHIYVVLDMFSKGGPDHILVKDSIEYDCQRSLKKELISGGKYLLEAGKEDTQRNMHHFFFTCSKHFINHREQFFQHKLNQCTFKRLSN